MTIGFFGAGKMAEGILQALLAQGFKPSEVTLAEKSASRAAEVASRYGVAVVSDLRAVAKAADIIFLAVRPQDVASVAAEVGGTLDEAKLLVSIVAGQTLAALGEAFGLRARLVRVMPNLALRVREGMCAVAAGPSATRDDLKRVTALLGGAGEVVELDERHFDAVTALSGSGPAFYAAVAEAMISGGVGLGLEPDVARLLAVQTMLGTARYLKATNADLGAFVAGVATKGGTTAAGMDVMNASDIGAVLARTLAAAARRSAELRG